MSTEEPQQRHVNHPLTELVIGGINVTVSTVRATIKGFRLVKEGLSEMETFFDSKYQKFTGKIRSHRKNQQFSEEAFKSSETREKSFGKLNDAQHLLVKPGKEKTVGYWMMGIAVLVYAMICLGAYTRLLKFGHSITGMHPTGLKQHYDTFKNYVEHFLWKKSYDFELLFLHEYLSTLFERAIGLLFLAPFCFFLFKGYIRQKLRNRLFGLMAMHLLQSFIGTWIHNVESRHKLGVEGRMLVSPYRMFVHWNTTMLMFGVLLWNALTLLRGPREKGMYGGFKDMRSMRKKMMINLGVNIANFMTGVIVAALDGAREFNTFPDMNGRIIPEGYLQEKWFLRDLFENVATAQFNHRLFAYGTYGGAVFLFTLSRKYNLSQFSRRAILTLFIVANLQLIDGILVLLTKGYWLVGFFHQSNAIWILGSSLFALHTLSVPYSSEMGREEKEEMQNSPRKMRNEELKPEELTTKTVQENPIKAAEPSQTEIEKQNAPTEPAGETTKEPQGTSHIKAPERNIHSKNESQGLENQGLSSEPVMETRK